MKDFHHNEEKRKLVLSDFLEGELEPVLEFEVSAHVENCAECNDYLNSLKMVSSSLEIFLEEAAPPMPENFTKRVRAAAESDISEIRNGNERLWGLGISAVLLLVVAVLVASNLGYSNAYVQSAISIPMAAIDFVVSGLYKISLTASVVFRTVFNQYLFRSAFSVVLVIGITAFSIAVFSKHMRGYLRS